jgi:hypothetical protein
LKSHLNLSKQAASQRQRRVSNQSRGKIEKIVKQRKRKQKSPQVMRAQGKQLLKGQMMKVVVQEALW